MTMISIATARESAGRPPYLPLTLHFSSRASSASATERGIPTTTSALLVRRLKRGNEPASGPGTERMGFQVSTHPSVSVWGLSGALAYGGFERRIDRPSNVTSQSAPLSVYGLWMAFLRRTCDSYRKGEQTFSAVTTSRVALCAHFRSPCIMGKYRRQPQNLAIPAALQALTLKITSPLSRSESHTFGARRCMSQ
jgi:hypothetical protein